MLLSGLLKDIINAALFQSETLAQGYKEMQNFQTTATTGLLWDSKGNDSSIIHPVRVMKANSSNALVLAGSRTLLPCPVLSLRRAPSHQHLTANKAFLPTQALDRRQHTSWTRGGNLSGTPAPLPPLLTPAETLGAAQINKRDFYTHSN